MVYDPVGGSNAATVSEGTMWGRFAMGAGALGLYAWRVEDPKGSYAAFYDASEWATAFFLDGEGAVGYLRNFINIVLVDQADGFLLGMAFAAILSILFWPVRQVCRACARGARRALGRPRETPAVEEKPDVPPLTALDRPSRGPMLVASTRPPRP